MSVASLQQHQGLISATRTSPLPFTAILEAIRPHRVAVLHPIGNHLGLNLRSQHPPFSYAALIGMCKRRRAGRWMGPAHCETLQRVPHHPRKGMLS